MPRGKGRTVLPHRNAAARRRPPPVAPRQVERQNLRRRPRAQLEQAEDHGVPVQVQQPNDNDPQPAYQSAPAQPPYQPAPAQDHHNENAPPPHILTAPQVVQPVPQIENGEALLIPTKSDIDVFVSPNMCNQIWNLEYIDLAHLLFKNVVSNIDKPKKVLGFDEDGDILIERSKYSKVKSITNIEEWLEDFFNYIKILLKRFPALANDLISYMSVIRSAVPDVPFEKLYRYDQQFLPRMARDHRRSWATIDGQF
jgi:predicted nucleotidyltransferase